MNIQSGPKREEEAKKILLILKEVLSDEMYNEFYQKRAFLDDLKIDLSSKLRFLIYILEKFING